MISIIIPVFNEEKQILNLLSHLREISAGKIQEIIVVDGGSNDTTATILASQENIVFLKSEKGRAKQMNAGAAVAKAPILYFLHADSYPPVNFDSLILKEISKGNKSGCFRMKFDHKHWWLTIMGQLTRINHKFCRGGDQSLFVGKDLFKKMGGFNEAYSIYEDNEFISRLYQKKQFVVIQDWITTSARLYEKMGIWKAQYLHFQIYWKKWRGAGPEELHRHYRSKVI